MELEHKPFRWVVAGVLFMSILFMQMSYASLPSLFSEISRDIPLDKSQMGLIVGMIPLACVIFALPGGALSDMIGSRLAIGGGLFIAAIAGGLRAQASGVTELAALTFFVGVTMALLPPNVARVIGAWFPRDELGKANGIVLSAVPIGASIGLAAGSSVLSAHLGGWRGAMVCLALLCLLMSVVWMFVYRERGAGSASSDGLSVILEHVREVRSSGDVWLIAAFSGCIYFAMESLMGLLPIILEERGIGGAGGFASILMLAGVIGGPLGGLASDMVGARKPFLMMSAAVMAVCAPFLAALTGISLAAVLVVAGFASGVLLPIMMAALMEIRGVRLSHLATAVGLVMTIGNAIGFCGPIASGMLIDSTGSPVAALVLISAVLAIAAVLVIPFGRPCRKEIAFKA